MTGKMSGDRAKLLQLKFFASKWENGSEMPIKIYSAQTFVSIMDKDRKKSHDLGSY